MLILLKVMAVLAFIIVPLMPAKRRVRPYKRSKDISEFAVNEDGNILHVEHECDTDHRANKK